MFILAKIQLFFFGKNDDIVRFCLDISFCICSYNLFYVEELALSNVRHHIFFLPGNLSVCTYAIQNTHVHAHIYQHNTRDRETDRERQRERHRESTTHICLMCSDYLLYRDVFFFFFFFFDLGFTALSRIFHLYRADRSSKVGENRSTRRKTT